MLAQLPQLVSHYVSSFLGAIGHDHNADDHFFSTRKRFDSCVLAVQRVQETTANVSPSQSLIWNIVDHLQPKVSSEKQIDWSSHLKFEAFGEPH